MQWRGKRSPLVSFGILVGLACLVVIAITMRATKSRNLFVRVNSEMMAQAPGSAPAGGPGMAGGMPGGVAGKYSSNFSEASDATAYAAPVPAKVTHKVIMTGNVTLEVKKFEKVHADVVKVAKQLGGYVANSQLNLPTEGAQSGTVTIRVPQERYDEALDRIKKFGKVVTENQVAEDVTQKYVDLDARVRNLKAEEERILDIMKRAKTIKETLQVDQRLTELREKIEVIEGQFRYLKFQIEMATITVTLTEKATTLHLPEPKWVWFNQVKSAWHVVVVVAQALASVLTYFAILGIFWVPATIVYLIVRKYRRPE